MLKKPFGRLSYRFCFDTAWSAGNLLLCLVNALNLYQARAAISLLLPLNSKVMGYGKRRALSSTTYVSTRAGIFESHFFQNGLKRVVRTREGVDLVCRVIVIHKEGHECLKALRRLAVGANTLLADNHVLPMVRELHFEDIVCGLFPLTGPSMVTSFGPRAGFVRNSVGDIMDMLLQALEVN